MKTASKFLDEANAVVPRLEAAAAIAEHGSDGAVFIDVRDSSAIANTGTIAGALRIPRGFIEFAADDSTQFHNAALTKDARIFLVCGAGGQAALAGKTLIEMGYDRVSNIGGIGEWIDAGGAMEN